MPIAVGHIDHIVMRGPDVSAAGVIAVASGHEGIVVDAGPCDGCCAAGP